MNPKRSECIENHLNLYADPSLARLYSADMEVQVQVARDNGEEVISQYMGKNWKSYTDGITSWNPFRIPRNADTIPEDNDTEMSYDLHEHVQAIGMTGWDWNNKVSKWVGFDFDAITGHSDKHAKKMTEEELIQLRKAIEDIPWVTLRTSTGGRGLHLYIFLDNIPTENHKEHAALARAILEQLSLACQFPLSTKVDVCGHILWVWHRKLQENPDGLRLIKQGSVLKDIPENWRDHVDVVCGRSSVTKVFDRHDLQGMESQRTAVKLDKKHYEFLEACQGKGYTWSFHCDHNMLITHTKLFAEIFNDVSFKVKGHYSTISEGTDPGNPNCFAFPIKDGAWVIRRFTPGTAESRSWFQDGQKWTKCFFNKELDFLTACYSMGGIEQAKGFQFRTAEEAVKALEFIGISALVADRYLKRTAYLTQLKDQRIQFQIDYNNLDNVERGMEDWTIDKKFWVKFFRAPFLPNTDEVDISTCDDLVRHLIMEDNSNYGWVIRPEENWHAEPLQHVERFLQMQYDATRAKQIIGTCVSRPWRIVNLPFQPEYPGSRQWNKGSIQFKVIPSIETDDLMFPTWDKVMNHLGAGLDPYIAEDPWSIVNGIKTGADYLKCWMASVIQEPFQPLPYLAFWGDQDCGKSTFHEAFSLLVEGGVKKVDQAVTTQSDFNGELKTALVAVVEEVNVNASKLAYNRIKEWTTALTISLREMYSPPVMVPNMTHWCQFCNDPSYIPVYPGDSRMTIIHVSKLESTIPKRELLASLTKEAPDFLAYLLKIELPPSGSRLNLPVIQTLDKVELCKSNANPVQIFLDEHCHYCEGAMLHVDQFFKVFLSTLSSQEKTTYSRNKFHHYLPEEHAKGKHSDNQSYLINLALEPRSKQGNKLKVVNGRITVDAEAFVAQEEQK